MLVQFIYFAKEFNQSFV